MKDRYGREVCKGMRGSTDVNLEKLRAGMAWWYREHAKQQPPQDREDYASEEYNVTAAKRELGTDAKLAFPHPSDRLG